MDVYAMSLWSSQTRNEAISLGKGNVHYAICISRYSPTSCPKRMLEVSPIITSKLSYLLSRIHQNSFMGTGLTFRCQLSCSHSWGGGDWPCAAVS